MTQRRKLWMAVTAVVLVLSLLASVLLVFADEYVIPEITPTYVPVPTPAPSGSGGAFTTPGNGEVQDHVDKEGSKEFYTVQTHNGNTFYLVIDKERLDDNAYLLSQVDERDLMEFIDEEPEPEETPAVVLEEPVTEEPEKNNRSSVLWTILLLLLAAGGVAYWYFRLYLPAKDEPTIPMSEGLETEGMGEPEWEDFPEEEMPVPEDTGETVGDPDTKGEDDT